ncbi:MAG: tRNA (adenosine(37)-N6)-threonylcarbamoyltransferase complex transferase subunit TsaD [Candidatus Uhrbacteria bacterium]|nr:tRNA (adenosine(37)-N6)-threonylcarbamoyltransferase complex transferase subunit TsaD [Candidatus Uhrbacteria bacterium]
MRILAIESSCDETAIAILDGEGERVSLASSVVRSQIDIHEAYGGVVPEVAAREHLEVLAPMLREHVPADGSGIDAIAVTAGPGLAPALRVGVETAKALAWAWNKPLVPVCHLEGHIYASWLAESGKTQAESPKFPALALIVSGGHTELVLMKGHGVFERLGETLDDAAGEAFDKVAKMIGLPYPGGPQIDALAVRGNPKAFDFPRALLDRDDFAFSFAGLKTAVLYTLRKHEDQLADDQFRADIAASFQAAVIDALLVKTARAVMTTKPASVVLAGGVAANVELRKRLADMCGELGVPLFVPPFKYSLDNAAMIAVAGYFRARDGKFADPLTFSVDPNMDIA